MHSNRLARSCKRGNVSRTRGATLQRKILMIHGYFERLVRIRNSRHPSVPRLGTVESTTILERNDRRGCQQRRWERDGDPKNLTERRLGNKRPMQRRGQCLWASQSSCNGSLFCRAVAPRIADENVHVHRYYVVAVIMYHPHGRFMATILMTA